MLGLRIADRAFLNLIRKWLKSDILEVDGKVIHLDTGTPRVKHLSCAVRPANGYSVRAGGSRNGSNTTAICQGGYSSEV